MRKAILFLFCSLFCQLTLVAEERTTIGRYLSSLGNHLEIEGSALYWRACRDDRLYAVEGTGVLGVTLHYEIVKPSTTWGWRAKGTLCPNDYFFFDAEYAYFHVHDNATTVNDAFDQSYFLNPVPSITARVTNDYQRARVRSGLYLYDGFRGDIYTFGGVSWIYLNEKDRLDSPPVAGFPLYLIQQSNFRGGGFEAGLGGDLRLFNSLTLKAECNVVGAIGNRHYSLTLSSNSVAGPFVQNRYPNETICIPGFDMRIEIDYQLNRLNGFSFAVGYEHHQFFNALLLNPLYYVISTAAPAFNSRAALLIDEMNLGYAGLYGTIKIHF